MKLHAYSLTWAKFMRHPWLAVRSWRLWMWLRDTYGVSLDDEVPQRLKPLSSSPVSGTAEAVPFPKTRVRLFPVSHIVLSDQDLA